jgi:urease accessory protein
VTDSTLTAFRLSDSFLPVGTFTVSYGLEQLVQADRVTDAETLERLLETYLREQLGSAELVALRAAYDAAADCDVDGICVADRRLTAVTLPKEFRESSERSGNRLLSLQRELQTSDLLDQYARRVDTEVPGNHAVVLGAVAATADIDARRACLLCCHGFVTGLLGAAQRLMAIGHTEAQRILDTLQPAIVAAVDDSAERTLAEMTTFSPLIDIYAADHERADRRLFVS